MQCTRHMRAKCTNRCSDACRLSVLPRSARFDLCSMAVDSFLLLFAVCEPAGPGFDGSKNADPTMAAKQSQCIHTASGGYGTRERTCHQNWLMGNCGESQIGQRYEQKKKLIELAPFNKLCAILFVWTRIFLRWLLLLLFVRLHMEFMKNQQAPQQMSHFI